MHNYNFTDIRIGRGDFSHLFGRIDKLGNSGHYEWLQPVATWITNGGRNSFVAGLCRLILTQFLDIIDQKK